MAVSPRARQRPTQPKKPRPSRPPKRTSSVRHTRAIQRDRTKRPVAPPLAWAKARYVSVLALDGSTLDALLKKVGLLRQAEKNPLAGRMAALLDVASRLPHRVWYEEDPQAHDQRFWERAVKTLAEGSLLLIDLGFTHFGHFADLTRRKVTFITRAKNNLRFEVERWLQRGPQLQEALIFIGSGQDRQRVRLVQVLVGRVWHRYLTNELDSERLPAPYVAGLYGERWRIEDAYAAVKRLLGLA